MGGDFLPLVQMEFFMSDLLVRLVSLAGQDDDVPGLGVVHGPADGLAAVFNDGGWRLILGDAHENLVDDGHGILGAGIVGGHHHQIGQIRGNFAHDGGA